MLNELLNISESQVSNTWFGFKIPALPGCQDCCEDPMKPRQFS